MLEYFVHLDENEPPDDLVLAVAEVPDSIGRATIEAAQLPARWREPAAPSELTRFGDEFAQRAEHCLLLVPSVLAPSENNCLINPGHADFRRLVVADMEALKYDSRMFRKKQTPRRSASASATGHSAS
jgi:RES domain-containing protein